MKQCKIHFIPLNGFGKYKPKPLWSIEEIINDTLSLKI